MLDAIAFIAIVTAASSCERAWLPEVPRRWAHCRAGGLLLPASKAAASAANYESAGMIKPQDRDPECRWAWNLSIQRPRC
jgi:hypothetical protein